MTELKWEEIKHDNGFHLRRTKVFGGWLVAAISDVQTLQNECAGFFNRAEGCEWRTSITIVPDPNNEWILS